MFGNLMSNTLIIQAQEKGDIRITPFDKNKLQTVHYPLLAKALYKKLPDGMNVELKRDFRGDENPYTFDENEYLVLEINESIILEKGIVGKFVPSSNLVEQGFGITAGRIEHPFGQNGEVSRFGIKNLTDSPNPLNAFERVAYLELFDLRGLEIHGFQITQRELELFVRRLRRAEDDGVVYK